MLRERINLFRRLVFIVDLCVVGLAFQFSLVIDRIGPDGGLSIMVRDGLFIPAIAIWGIVLWFLPECYTIRLRNIGEILRSVFKTAIISTGLFIAYVFAFGHLDQSRFQIFLFSGASFTLLGIFRLSLVSFLEYCRSRGYNNQTVLIIGTGASAKGFVDKILNNTRFGLKVIGFIDWERRAHLWRYRDIPCIGALEDMPELLKTRQVDWAIFAVGRRYLGKIEPSIGICERMGIQIAVLADFFPMKLAKKRVDTFFDSPFICYDMAPQTGISLIAKNILDRILAAAAIALSAPLMFTAAIAIKISSGGAVIYRQERCGLNGRKFTLYKFRTMVRDADRKKNELAALNEMDGPVFKIKNDPRITTVGKFLRKTSIDELPQLVNVLKGDMSIVGPRPPLADEVARYDLWQRRKLSMKPGLTCLWQINGRSNVSFEQWMKLDLKYIDNWSLWEDAKIVAKTVPAVLKGTGAR